mmetsp:Transcript_22946/g.40949  ORF Transcript_22946/g.40949 Transcript_22946/m.40949 type:complete len:140 (-) Transcript_22946:507-926(-)
MKHNLITAEGDLVGLAEGDFVGAWVGEDDYSQNVIQGSRIGQKNAESMSGKTGTAGLWLSSTVNPFNMFTTLTGDDVGLDVGIFVGNGVHLLGRNLQVPPILEALPVQHCIKVEYVGSPSDAFPMLVHASSSTLKYHRL